MTVERNQSREKDNIREEVWEKLSKVAIPDSRFHLNFAEFIPNFEGSEQALTRLLNLDLYQTSKRILITPDNCLEKLREQIIQDQKQLIVPTYGIRRGMILLERERIPQGQEQFASSLDGMERFGKHLSLADIQGLGKIDFLVTGASVVSTNGVRYGKGHGFFDLEWAMMREIGSADENTPVIAFVHNCQIIESNLKPTPFDTVSDIIITPKQIINIPKIHQKPIGVYWELLDPQLLKNIPLLSELKNIQENDRQAH